jgi:3',5'-cyclic AMP phosphodiesterase CpdA
MALTLGLVTDLHFGPEARFNGKLRKLTHHAPGLARAFVKTMNEEVRPDLIVNLGDDIEDESLQADRTRYEECQAILRGARAPLVNVAGNHDTIHLSKDDLNRVWGRQGPLHYSFDLGDFHFVVLHTMEKKDVEVRVFEPQLAWLRNDLDATPLPTVVLMHHPASDQDLDDSRWFRDAEHIALVKERKELRAIFEDSKKVRAVFNGHVHRNHIDVIRGIPYVTLQSLIENLHDDAPGLPSASYAVVRLSHERMVVRVRGNDPARYQVEFS